MADTRDRYYAFWASLLPRSNPRTGFSLRRPTKRPYVEYCRQGFCFHYRLEDAQPNAQVAFTLQRSDSDEIYAQLVQQRAAIEAAIGAPLTWLPAWRSPEHRWPAPAIVQVIACPSLRDLDQAAWPALQMQMIEAMVRLERTLVPQLHPWLTDD
jgi:hypothetical protein